MEDIELKKAMRLTFSVELASAQTNMALLRQNRTLAHQLTQQDKEKSSLDKASANAKIDSAFDKEVKNLLANFVNIYFECTQYLTRTTKEAANKFYTEVYHELSLLEQIGFKEHLEPSYMI